jgi:hypothetical protein
MANTNLNQRAAAVRDHVWTPKNTGLKEVTEKLKELADIVAQALTGKPAEEEPAPHLAAVPQPGFPGKPAGLVE